MSFILHLQYFSLIYFKLLSLSPLFFLSFSLFPLFFLSFSPSLYSLSFSPSLYHSFSFSPSLYHSFSLHLFTPSIHCLFLRVSLDQSVPQVALDSVRLRILQPENRLNHTQLWCSSVNTRYTQPIIHHHSSTNNCRTSVHSSCN